MKHYLAALFALVASALLTFNSALAQTPEKMVVALKTDDFNLSETDISTLAIGEAQTIETDSGRIIDILRTSEGAEIYVDGELIEMNFSHDDHTVPGWATEDGGHVVIHKEVEVACHDEQDGHCKNKLVLISGDEDIDLEQLHKDHENGEGHKIIVIKKTLVSED